MEVKCHNSASNHQNNHHLEFSLTGLFEKQTGIVWTGNAHITTAVIDTTILTIAWAMSELGWVAGPTVMLLFALVTYFTSPPPATYMDPVRSNLGERKMKISGWIHYLNLYGVAIGYTIAASISMMAIQRSNCFHISAGKNTCQISSKPYIIIFGIAQIIFSQIPGFDLISLLSIVASFISLTYSTMGLGLGVAKLADFGTITQVEKIWRSFNALGDFAFSCSYSMILIDIQETVRSPPLKASATKRATRVSVVVTTIIYVVYGFIGYAAFGDSKPEYLISGFGFYNPYWILDIANVTIVVHLLMVYQVTSQPLFAFIEKNVIPLFSNSEFITKEIKIPIPGYNSYNFNLFRLVSRTIFVIVTTVVSMILPFGDTIGLLVVFGFWPLIVYYHVMIYEARTP